MKEHSIERISWTDSGERLANLWQTVEEIASHAAGWHGEVVSVGFVVHEDKRVVLLGTSLDYDHDAVVGVQLIQKTAIRKREVL